jgi:hypothetical protein
MMEDAIALYNFLGGDCLNWETRGTRKTRGKGAEGAEEAEEPEEAD